ncbi:hypothetical protein [Streptomyces kanamyceticus]|uniref:Uncharacterized protein n=1 Tax=Streptomyces kanamyceticus TaxID=1967 RepID=A0A5J6GC66_STRKN|nr:hypothetical protein [Streptomyces kanamyceticus]QEU90846.1 hypothetical protein CP970_07995 [Streptomyces kanamyceticus]
MSEQLPPESVRKAATALYGAAVLAMTAAVVIVIDQAAGNDLAQQLHQAYPRRSTNETGMAESSILTYLFTLAAIGAALFVWMARASRRGRRWVRGAGTAVVALGSVAAVYNFSQPHPLLMTAVGVLPCVSALTATALLWKRESSLYFKSTPRTTTA